ncbi:hypothetical protein D3C75_1084750 [compost metagenome]
MTHPLGFFEQREIGERAPQRSTSAITQQQAAARMLGDQFRPEVEAGVEVGVRHGFIVPGGSRDRRDFNMPPGCHQCR